MSRVADEQESRTEPPVQPVDPHGEELHLIPVRHFPDALGAKGQASTIVAECQAGATHVIRRAFGITQPTCQCPRVG
jgi:hypothetical protein